MTNERVDDLIARIRSFSRFRRYTVIIGVVVTAVLLLVFARGGTREPVEEEPMEPESPVEVVEPEEPEEPEEEKEEPEEVPPDGSIRNPLTGLWAPEETVSRRTLGVVIDNAPLARPHVGLGKAEVVFELLVEGGATRFLALFLAEEPEIVGPVRSARHYFLDVLSALDAVMVHCGGSPQYYEAREQRGIVTLDDLRGGGDFFRVSSPGVPYEHTLFTNVAGNRAQLADREWEAQEPPASPWGFAEGRDGPGIYGQRGQDMDAFAVKFPPGHATYSTRYTYDEETERYARYLNDEPHADRESGEAWTFANVVILWVDTHRIPGDREGRLDMHLGGSGDALVITAGRGYSCFWSTEDGFRLHGPRDREVRLSPGHTWVAIVPTDTAIQVEGLQP